MFKVRTFCVLWMTEAYFKSLTNMEQYHYNKLSLKERGGRMKL